MRKITEQLVRSFLNGDDMTKDNTKVVSAKNSSYLYLYSNMIAKRVEGSIFLSHCGWKTPTTKELLNGVLSMLNKPNIYQKDFVWYWKDGQEFKPGWNKL